MPSPTFGQVPYRWHARQIVRFGGRPIPVTGAILPFVDLNDKVAWHTVEGPKIDNSHISNAASQLSLRGKGVWTAQDFIGRKLRLPVYYDETCGVPFSQAKAYLTQTGEQYLTFDGVTGLLARCNSFAESDFLTDAPDAPSQYTHKCVLEFMSRNPFPEDMSTIYLGPWTVTNAATAFSVNLPYAGLVYGEPQFLFHFDGTQPSAATGIVIANASSGEVLGTTSTIPARQAADVFIDCVNLTTTQNGVPAPVQGSYPFLYPGFPPPFTNVIQARISGAGSLYATLTMKYTNKWEL